MKLKQPSYLLFFIGFFLFSNQSYNAQSYENLDTIKYPNLSSLSPKNFYGTNHKFLQHYINSSAKKYKMVFTFTEWCKPCREKHPEILKLQKDYDTTLDVFFVADIYTRSNLAKTAAYLTDIGNASPIFMLADELKNKVKGKDKYEYFLYSPEKGRKVKVDRYIYQMNMLVPTLKDYGYSLIILYDSTNKPIYASTYHETHDEILRKIKTLLDQ